MRKEESSYTLSAKIYLCLVIVLFVSCDFILAADESLGQTGVIDSSTNSVFNFRSISGKYAIAGRDRPEILGISKWIDEVISRVEKMISVDLPFNRTNYFRVVLDEVDSDNGQTQSAAEVTEKVIEGRNIPTLILHNYYNIDREQALSGLCRVLLNGEIAERGGANSIAPAWLIKGLAQVLFVSDREKNNRTVATLWREGGVGSVMEIIESGAPQNVAVYGVFVEWLLSFSKDLAIFDKILMKVSEEGNISRAWFSDFLAGIDSGADVEEEWDKWILSMKNRVYVLGVLNIDLVNQLRAELLIYRGSFGIPVYSEVARVVTFRDLIALQDKDWIPSVCKEKKLSVLMLAMGKSRKFADVVNKYCDFLDALNDGKSKRRLTRMLDDADNELRKLEEYLGLQLLMYGNEPKMEGFE